MIKVGDIIEVKWSDASQREYTLQEIDELITRDILVEQTTYGKLIVIGDDLILLQHEEDNYSIEEKECTAIPRSWIIYPKSLRDKRMLKKL